MTNTSINRAKERLSKYSTLFYACSADGLAYAKCVSKQDEIKRNCCAPEFEAFKSCLRKAAEKLGTKI